MFFLQFHKAGGSSFCALFHHAGLRTHDTHAGVRRPGHAHCNCKSKLLGNLSSPEGPRLMMAEMARRNLDVCMMEESWKFPVADALRRFAIQWRALGGEIATTIRDPWARFESTFLREHGTSVHKGYGNLTIQQFAQPDFREHPAGREAAKYGAFNRPNFYVRLLNGLDGRGGGKDRHGAKHGVGPEASIGPRELQRALDALAQFDHVFLLDGDLQAAARKELMGRDTSMPRASNSHYSSENLRLHPERVALLPETKSYRTRFALENCADRALYAAVQRQVRLAGTCRGCTPEDFFLAAEKSPRPPLPLDPRGARLPRPLGVPPELLGPPRGKSRQGGRLEFVRPVCTVVRSRTVPPCFDTSTSDSKIH